MCPEIEDYRDKLAQMRKIYATLKTVGPQTAPLCIQVPSKESIYGMVRERVLSERHYSAKRKIECKYALKRLFDSDKKTLDCLNQETLQAIPEVDPRYAGLFQSRDLWGLAGDFKEQAFEKVEYIGTQSSKQTL